MRRIVLAVIAAALAGCSSTETREPGPRKVALWVIEDGAQVEKDRQVLRRLLGHDSRSIGELLGEHVAHELDLRGISVVEIAPEGTDTGPVLEELRARGERDGLVTIRVGKWDLDAVPTAQTATVEFGMTLFETATGREVWLHEHSRRNVRLQTGEHRDISSLVQRLAMEALRSYP